MEDERIVLLYWDRDEAAISESSMKYGAYCTSIAQNILQNPADAEECVNDTASCVECHAAAPAVSVIDISWKDNKKSFV